jgi:hypothetical protein
MKNTSIIFGIRLLVLITVQSTLFISCENEEQINVQIDKLKLQESVNDLPDNLNIERNLGARSNSSSRLITGMDRTNPNYPFLSMDYAFSSGGSAYSWGNTIPANSTTACSVVGDFNGDGVDELIIGYNSPNGPFLIKNTGPYLLSNYTQFYTGSTFWTLAGVAAVDFDGDGVDELVTAFNSGQGPALYKGTTSNIGTKIFQGSTSRSIVAIAAGDFIGNGNEELISAFNSSSGPSLYRSQGSNVGSIFYQGSTFWSLAAVTAADFDNNGIDELMTGFHSSLGPAIYKGNATIIGTKIYQGTTSIGTIRALTSGKFGSTCTMHVGFYSSTTGTKIYAHDGTNLLNIVVSWSSPTYTVKSLASGTFKFAWE